MITTLKRVIRNGCIGFYRNKTISVSAIVIMTVTLLIIGGLIYSRAMLKHVVYHAQEKVDVSAYFVVSAKEDIILQFKQEIEKLPEVKKVTYVSREEALAQFEERHKDDALALQAIREIGENPLRASLFIQAQNSGQYESVARFLKKNETDNNQNPLIDSVDYEDNKTIIDQLNQLIATVNRTGLTFALIFILISILITYNTVRLAIYVFRDEIGIMRLVGADRFYVRGPFVVEGILYGVIAGLLATILYWPISIYIRQYVKSALVQFDTLEFYMLKGWLLGLVLIGTGVILGMISSYLAVRKYLKR
jgi:cell division transport system permease protein